MQIVDYQGRRLHFLRLPDVLARVKVSGITIYRWEKQGRFPLRHKLGPNSVAWLESEVDEWCARKAGQA
jgi:prophage regulatory protein